MRWRAWGCGGAPSCCTLLKRCPRQRKSGHAQCCRREHKAIRSRVSQGDHGWVGPWTCSKGMVIRVNAHTGDHDTEVQGVLTHNQPGANFCKLQQTPASPLHISPKPTEHLANLLLVLNCTHFL